MLNLHFQIIDNNIMHISKEFSNLRVLSPQGNLTAATDLVLMMKLQVFVFWVNVPKMYYVLLLFDNITDSQESIFVYDGPGFLSDEIDHKGKRNGEKIDDFFEFEMFC